MKKIKLFFTAVMVLLSVSLAYAQNFTVSGVVTDANTGDPVPFASISVRGTMNGASADANGQYSIKVSSKDAVLLFSFIGYKTVAIPVEGKTIIDCALEEDAVSLDDVVIVAYGSAKREAVTGSVTSVKGEQLASTPVTSVDKALSGKLAGVQITSTSGQPGASSQIRIRGTSSINASNNPLWVVDGIPIISGGSGDMVNTSNGLATLNPNDIESITVLKDAAAAAVYGSRAANGVILVTTKSGKEGRAQFDARVKYGVSWLQCDNKDFRVMTGEELLGYQRDAIINAGMDPDDPDGPYYRPMSLLDGEMTDWLDEFTKLGTLQEYEISARGGNSKSKYFTSISYHENEGVFYGVDYQKFQARVNADYSLLKNLSTGVRVNAAYTDQNDVPMQALYYSNPIWAGETLMPWIPAYDEDGNYNLNTPSIGNQNPRATAEYEDQWSKNYKFQGTMYLKWEPIKNLVMETKNSAELSFAEDRRYWDPRAYGYATDATLQTSNSQYSNLTTSNTINYSNVFGGYHSLRVLLGQEANTYRYRYNYVYAPDVDPDIPYVNTAPQEKVEASVDYSNETMLSFFGIADYNYDNRYFVQGTVRTDGSSLFGEKNKWGLFWSASASWNISSEEFMKNARAVDLVKLRLSYGVNGNNGIAAYRAYGVYATTSYNGGVGMLPSQPENQNLSWEKNKTWNVGVDFGFLNRITGSIDVYSRLTDDMLLNVQVPQTTGFSTNFKNAGSMSNTGIEFQMDATLIQTQDVIWTFGFNIAHNKTKIINLETDNGYIGNTVRQVEGKSMYTYYLPEYYGVNPTTGECLWVTKDGSLSTNYADARSIYCGSPEPKVIGGFNTVFNWKGLQLSAFFEFKGGSKVLRWNEGRYLNSDGERMTMNQLASALNYWKEPGDTGCNPKPIAGNAVTSQVAFTTTRWVQKSDYLRIKDVTLSYNLPTKVTNAIHVKGLRVYVSGLNLYCFHDVDFWDPEEGAWGYTGGAYPLTKSFVGGLEISF